MIYTPPLVRASLAFFAAAVIVSLSGCLGSSPHRYSSAQQPHSVTGPAVASPSSPEQAGGEISFEAGANLDPTSPLALKLALGSDWLFFRMDGRSDYSASAHGCSITVTETTVADAPEAVPQGDEAASAQLLAQTVLGLDENSAITEKRDVAEVATSGGETASFLRYKAQRLDGTHTLALVRAFETLDQAMAIVMRCSGEAPAVESTIETVFAAIYLRPRDSLTVG